MDVFDLVAKLTLDKSGYEKELNNASAFTSKIGGAITSVAGTVAKVGTGMVVAGAGAVTAITKQAVDAYANYEQLTGGVKKLFSETNLSLWEYAEQQKKTADEVLDEWLKLTAGERKVLNNSREAYKTAGMSMNDYMETVTSFSASLIKSLDGDMVKASDLADIAIRDMADNVNTYGSSMESVQSAYQGFAKGNYTMLDNLKLGYGGTATEMAKLINDSGVLGDKMIDLSDTTKIGAQLAEVGFGKMVEAIHKVQENMNIAGTTSKEAMGTISGSLGMLKASWQNVLTGIGEDNEMLYDYIDQLAESAGAVVTNMIPVIERSLDGIGVVIEQVAPVIIERLPALVEELLPKLIEATKKLVGKLVDVLPQIFQTVRKVLPEILSEIFGAIGADVDVDGLMELVDNVIDLFSGIGDVLSPVIDIASKVLNTVVSVLNAIIENQDALDMIESIGIAIGIVVGAIEAWSVVQGILNAVMALNPIGLLITAIGILIAVIVMLVKHWDEVVEATEMVWEAMKEAFGHLGEWFKGIWEDIKKAFAGVGDWFKNLFTKAKDGIKSAWSNITGFFTEKWEAIKNIFATAKDKFKDIGRNIVEGIKNGILNAWDSFKSWIMGKFQGIVDGVKGVFGIHSPSKVFQNIGEMMVAGLENGSDGLFDGSDFGINASVKTENTNNDRFSIDYEQLGASVANALAGFSINMDGRTVAQLIAGDMNYELGRLTLRGANL